jgi:hypothetical protein
MKQFFMSHRILMLWGALLLGTTLVSCQSTGGGGGAFGGVERARAAQIAQEPRGPWYVGRRYYTMGTRFWGYLRKPGQPWDGAEIVIINEKQMRQPDRLPEYNPSGLQHGYDHNAEYRMWGYFTGERVYDPNSNFILPEFMLQKYELVTRNPGYLFEPQEDYNPRLLPPKR